MGTIWSMQLKNGPLDGNREVENRGNPKIIQITNWPVLLILYPFSIRFRWFWKYSDFRRRTYKRIIIIIITNLIFFWHLNLNILENNLAYVSSMHTGINFQVLSKNYKAFLPSKSVKVQIGNLTQIQRVPALRAFWDFEKTVSHEICVSGSGNRVKGR